MVYTYINCIILDPGDLMIWFGENRETYKGDSGYWSGKSDLYMHAFIFLYAASLIHSL